MRTRKTAAHFADTLDELPKTVVALGDFAEAAARFYADATARPFGGVVRQLKDIGRETLAVVLTDTASVSPDLFDYLYPAGQRPWAAGLIYGRDSGEIMARASRIAALLPPLVEGRVVELYPYSKIGDIALGARRHIAGGVAGTDRLREHLVGDAAVMTVATHSDGFDLLLGDSMALCAALDGQGRDPRTAPCCHETGHCYRLDLPIEQVASSPGHVRPEEIRARILLLLTCFGFMPSSEARDGRWGYADALIDNPSLAAFVTGWSMLLPTAELIDDLLSAIYSGVTVGEAVARVNGGNHLSRLAVFGEPAMRIVPIEAEPGARYAVSCGQIAGDGGRFLAAILFQAAMSARPERMDRTAAAADAARLYEHAALMGLPTGDDTDIGRSMRDAVQAFFARSGALIFEHWMPMTETASRQPTVCHQCGSSAERIAYRFRSPGIESRSVELCPICGIRSDAPFSSDLVLKLTNNKLRLEGSLPRTNWRALIVLGCQDRTLSTSTPWPTRDDGAPAREAPLPADRPPGTILLGVVLIAEAEVIVLSLLIPASRSSFADK